MEDRMTQDAGRICRLVVVWLFAGSLFDGLRTGGAATPVTGRGVFVDSTTVEYL